jgi:cytochrome c oxidase assembly protein subunit 15
MRLPRLSAPTYARITVGACIAVVVIIVTGAAVRLTGSGLGCTDWPTCNDNHVVADWRLHPMVEFLNRVFTGIVSVAVILAVLGAFVRAPRRRDLLLLSFSLVLGVIGQAVLGGFTVLHKLDPRFVMAHFLLSMAIAWAAILLVHRAAQPDAPAVPVMHRDYIILARIMAVLAAVVVFIGTMVTGTGPHSGDENVHRLGFSLHHITKVHGIVAWCLIALSTFTVWRLRAAHATSTLVKRGELVVAALLMQGVIGYTQYALHLPPALVLLHVAGACGVWLSILWFNFGFYERYEPQQIAVYDEDEFPGSEFFTQPSP